MQIPKKYQPLDVESKWFEAWLEAKVFESTPDDREPYTIVIPPPNVTGILHMGHVLNNTIQDILIRRKRMQGFNALWVPGTDHASIATEAKVVKLLESQGIKKHDLSREEFLKHAFEWKEKYGGIILKQLKKLGASCDWNRTSFTMDEDYSKSVIQVFCDLYEKGYIYRGIRMVNWDPKALTAVSDEEVIYKDIPGKLYHIRYAIEGMPGEYVTIATTRPETILGDTAIAIHPEDERYKHLHGKKAIVPLVNRPVPIVLDDYVDREFGTGCLKVTPAHDINDYEIGIRHNLKTIDVLNDDGTISEAGELYIGEDRFAVRKTIQKDLDAAGHLVEVKDYPHSVGHSERSEAVIEPKLSMQWFLKMEDISKPAWDAVTNGEVNLIPAKYVNTYNHWMANVRDWCLSRQLWWGHQIPAYYINGGNEFVVAENDEDALEKAKAKTGDNSLTMDNLQQDPDVLDTWASSWLWPISVFKGLTEPDNPEISYYYPTNDLVTAPEILFFWVARMIISGYEYKGTFPFKNVYLHGIVRDDDGRKMSKQFGNSPDPIDLIDQYGADAVRFAMTKNAPPGNDMFYKDELVEEGRNFANKIWNAFRLVKGWETEDKAPSERDKIAIMWMQSRIQAAIAEIDGYFDQFHLSNAIKAIYHLKWDEFCSWFLEMVKPERGSGISSQTFEAVIDLFEQTMILLHPFMPFITEEIWQRLRERQTGEFITTTRMPSAMMVQQAILEEMALMQETISAIRAFKAQKGISNKEQLELSIKTDQQDLFERYFPILKRFLNTSSISFTSEQAEGTGSIRVKNHEFYIPMGAIDVEAEKAKIEEEIKYTQGFLQKVLNKLSNEKFVNNAPEKVVALERKKQSDAEAKLKVLEESLAQLG